MIGNSNEEEYYGIILANNRNTISFIDIKKLEIQNNSLTFYKSAKTGGGILIGLYH